MPGLIRAVVDTSILVRAFLKNDKVLEAATEGKARFIVMGDEDLLVLNPFEGILILGPSEFLRSLNPP